MKTIAQSNPVQLSKSIAVYKKLNDHLIKPIKAGFIGFSVILMIIFFFNLLLYVMTYNRNSKIDYLDFSLAGVGFVLQFSESLLKSLTG
jgi:hypothetical protein